MLVRFLILLAHIQELLEGLVNNGSTATLLDPFRKLIASSHMVLLFVLLKKKKGIRISLIR